MANIAEEIKKRRTFAIISHPDAGKTTLTEKFLLYGGAINLAGTVKGRKAAKYAVSDWMEIEKERGISVTSSISSISSKGSLASLSILLIKVKMGIWRMTHTLNSLMVWASTPLEPSMTMKAESAAIRVR